MNQAAKNNNANLSPEQVTDYLSSNTDFFLDNPDLLLKMKLSEQPEGSISLVERQMQGLRKRNKALEDELQQVIRNAQDNQHLLQYTIDLTLKLIPCEKIETLHEALSKQLDKLFNIKYQSLLR